MATQLHVTRVAPTPAAQRHRLAVAHICAAAIEDKKTSPVQQIQVNLAGDTLVDKKATMRSMGGCRAMTPQVPTQDSTT